MKILFISRWFPYPPDNGSKLRILHLLEGLTAHHEVWLLSFSDFPSRDQACPTMREMCRDIRVVAWKEYHPVSMRSLLGLFSLTPRSQADTYSPQMAGEITNLLEKVPFDLVITSQWQMVAYRHLFLHRPALFEELEVGVPYGQYRDARSLASRARHGLTWAKHRLFLSRLLANDQPCTVVSEEERSLLSKIAPRNKSISVVPNGVSLNAYAGISVEPVPDTLIFTGSFRYRPNYDAMIWFLQNVYPLIQQQVPQVKLTITGDPGELEIPSCTGVQQVGYVQDVKPLIAQAWVSLAPLQDGGGTRLKILEAMALGTPVVSTSKGVEGLKARPQHDILVADAPEDFAGNVVKLLREPRLRTKIAENARLLIRDVYDWQKIMPDFLNIVSLSALKNGDQT